MSELKGEPERIWLQYHGDENPELYPDTYPDDSEVSWCWEPIFEHDIEYIRLDKYTELEAELATLKAPARKCTQCPHVVGDLDVRDCCFPDCVGGFDKVFKELEAENKSLEALVGKWMSHDGHVCPSCGMPDNRMQELEAENKRLVAERDDALEKADHWEKTCHAQWETNQETEQQRNDLYKENRRLREELQKLITTIKRSSRSHFGFFSGYTTQFSDSEIDSAKKALEDTDE